MCSMLITLNIKMDFNTLMTVAQENVKSDKQTIKQCGYQTKSASRKKPTKQSKILEDNIKKFLARREEEEKRKILEEKRKKDNLLALRDQKAQSRISKHLKVCKAANKSVIADAIDNENTAITVAGPSQPDADDYGYESQVASALYNQFMNKYSSFPEKSIINNNEKKTEILKDIASTKDRVKQLLKQELEENGQRRKRKSSVLNAKEIQLDKKTEEDINSKVKEEDKKNKPKLGKVSSPMSFAELLKLAEIKQHEPVNINVKSKIDEERPMAKRQKKEWEYMQEKEKREQQKRINLQLTNKMNNTITSSKSNKTESNKIFKKSLNLNLIQNKNSFKNIINISEKSDDKHNIEKIQNISKDLLEERKRLEIERRHLEEMRRAIEEEKRKLAQTKSNEVNAKSKLSNTITDKSKSMDKQIPFKNIKSRSFPSKDIIPSSLNNNKLKKFSSFDVVISKNKQVAKKPFRSHKKQLISDDDDDEYDPDLKDFIVEGTEEDQVDYSKEISEIFGYDKNKYKHIDDKDDIHMESNFAQQMKEERISTKIGKMEDLEDMRKEELEKRKKILLKQKRKR